MTVEKWCEHCDSSLRDYEISKGKCLFCGDLVVEKPLEAKDEITEESIAQLEKDLIENPRPIEEVIVYNMNQFKDAAAKIGFPCIVRESTQKDF